MDSKPAKRRGKCFLDSFLLLKPAITPKITKFFIFLHADGFNYRLVCLKFPPHLKKNLFYSNFRINFHTSPHNIKLSTKTKNSTKTSSKRSSRSRAMTRLCRRAVRGTSPTVNATRKPRASTRRRTRGSPNSFRAKMCGAIGLPTNSCLCLRIMRR